MEHSIEWLILKHLSAAADWPKVFFSAILSHTQRREMVLYIQFVVCVAMMTSCFISTLFENYSKCRIWIFEFWHFPPNFVLSKLTCLVTLFDRKPQLFKNSPKWTNFGIFLLTFVSTQNVNVTGFARNVEWDFFCDFQTPCIRWIWELGQDWKKASFY